MVITLPEAITIKQRWPESVAWLYRGLLTWSPARSAVTPTSRSSQRCFSSRLAERGWGQLVCVWGHWSVFTGSKLSGFTHMAWNVRKRYITDRCSSASHGKSEVWLHTLYTGRQGMKARWREAAWKMVPRTHSSLKLLIKWRFFHAMFQKSDKHQMLHAYF